MSQCFLVICNLRNRERPLYLTSFFYDGVRDPIFNWTTKLERASIFSSKQSTALLSFMRASCVGGGCCAYRVDFAIDEDGDFINISLK